MKIILQLSIFVFTLLSANVLSAQVFWEGNGDGTSWNDPANWSTGAVPTAADAVEILIDATLTGDMTEGPMRIKTGASSTVKLHLDMELGSVEGEDHAFIVGAKSTVEFGEEGTPYTFNFNTAANKNGLLNNNSGDSSAIVIMKDATLNFDQHNNGLNLIAKHTTFENNGVINISSNTKNGIKCGGLFTNNGLISVDGVITDGLQIVGGSLTNSDMGTITTVKCGDDGIEILDEGVLTNSGIINSIAVDEASSGNNAIAVGTADTLGYLFNTLTGEVNADGGTSETARAVAISEEGVLTNAGLISTIGGNTATSIYTRNTLVNEVNGVIDLGDGRINANIGTLINNGYIKTTRDGAGIFVTENAAVTNNAFFWYEFAGQFASGEGVIEDNGFSLNNIFRFKIDAGGSCTVDIAEASYDWTINNNEYASSDVDGTFTFAPNSIAADSVVLKTSLPDVNIKVTNICQEAVMTTSVDDKEFASEINIYPSILAVGADLHIDFNDQNAMPTLANVYDLQGRLITQKTFSDNTTVSTYNWGVGQFVIQLVQGERATTKSIVIIK